MYMYLQLRIVNEANQVADIRTIGEIQFKCYLAIKEYRNDSKKTKEFFTEDGFAKTGLV